MSNHVRHYYSLTENRPIVTEAYREPKKVRSTARKYKMQPRQIRAWRVIVDKALIANISDTSNTTDSYDTNDSDDSIVFTEDNPTAEASAAARTNETTNGNTNEASAAARTNESTNGNTNEASAAARTNKTTNGNTNEASAINATNEATNGSTSAKVDALKKTVHGGRPSNLSVHWEQHAGLHNDNSSNDE
jgi:hypothetical protein